ncbi:MAG: hypothetical protein KDC54_24565, partial [Lewinella sp.]|nr:hypothetical protein [Lewinella sp.]
MKNQGNTLLRILGLLVLVILVSLVPELIGGDLAAALKSGLGDNYYFIIGGIGFFAILFYTRWSERDRLFERKEPAARQEAVSEDQLRKIREGLLDGYKARLRNKLASRFPFNLEVMYFVEGSPTKGPLYDNSTIDVADIKEELDTLFDRHRGRLLIVGAPGAGKTTLLLQLASQLIERGEAKIPVIINMATWRERFASVEEWLVELLPQMGFSKALARRMVEDKYLIPFFDGLDELAEEKRPTCLEAIGKFGEFPNARYTICSRLDEYAETADAPVYCQILVKPLTLIQIRAELERLNMPEARGVLQAIERDKLFAEAVKTPFYLNTVQLLFASMKTWEELGFA